MHNAERHYKTWSSSVTVEITWFQISALQIYRDFFFNEEKVSLLKSWKDKVFLLKSLKNKVFLFAFKLKILRWWNE